MISENLLFYFRVLSERSGSLNRLVFRAALSFHACQVIRALDPKLNPATAEIQALRNLLADRDKQIVNLEVNLKLYVKTQPFLNFFKGFQT